MVLKSNSQSPNVRIQFNYGLLHLHMNLDVSFPICLIMQKQKLNNCYESVTSKHQDRDTIFIVIYLASIAHSPFSSFPFILIRSLVVRHSVEKFVYIKFNLIYSCTKWCRSQFYAISSPKLSMHQRQKLSIHYKFIYENYTLFHIPSTNSLADGQLFR